VALFAPLAFATSASAATYKVPTVTASGTPANLDVFEDQVMVEINKARRSQGLARIRLYDSCVERKAERWGARIAATGKLEHRPQSNVIKSCKQAWAGETLIRGWDLTPAQMVKAWMDSPGHRAIILGPNARRAGMAVTIDSQDRMIGVLNVTRPSRRR
jgi:uncharacterized protein YkwD